MSTTVGLGQTHTLGCAWEPGSELESNTSTKRHKSTEARKRAAEDLELIPTTVAPLHCCIAKSRRGRGPQAYFSPRVLDLQRKGGRGVGDPIVDYAAVCL